MQKSSQKLLFPCLLWLFFRSTSISAALFSNAYPVLPIEKAIKVFPPSSEFNLWFNLSFLSPWLRWDAKHYVTLLVPGKSFKGLFKSWQGWLAATAAPSGLLIWAIYRIGYLKDFNHDLSHSRI